MQTWCYLSRNPSFMLLQTQVHNDTITAVFITIGAWGWDWISFGYACRFFFSHGKYFSNPKPEFMKYFQQFFGECCIDTLLPNQISSNFNFHLTTKSAVSVWNAPTYWYENLCQWQLIHRCLSLPNECKCGADDRYAPFPSFSFTWLSGGGEVGQLPIHTTN